MSLAVNSIAPTKPLTSPQGISLKAPAKTFSLGETGDKTAISMDAGKTPQPSEVKDKFQDFVAGTFFKQMMKAMRSSQKKPAYFHGGQAEDMFKGQMDDIMTSNLAKSHGAAISDPLFKVYEQQRANAVPASSKLDAVA